MKHRAIKYLAAAVLAAFIVASIVARASNDETRKLYALAYAGVEYCPQIATTSTGMASIGYDLNADDLEPGRLAAEKKNWVEAFNADGPRACELLMQQYGPGTSVELFKLR